ncbi:hypothetical protein ACTFIU_009464 [Dictyostelium citrinum]
MKFLLSVIVLLLSICFSNSTYLSFMGSYTDSTCEDSQPGLSYYTVNETCNSGLSSFLGTTPSNFGTKDGNSWNIAGGCASFFFEVDTFGFEGQCTLSPGFAKLETPYFTRVYQQYSLIYPNDAVIVEFYDTSLSNQCNRYQNSKWSAAIDNGFKYQSNDGSNNIYQYSCINGIPTINICDTKGNCAGQNLSTNYVNGVNVFCPQ